jgi:streptomycin 6-kinase
MGPISIPRELAVTQKAEGGAWVRALPALVDRMVERWDLAIVGPVMHGMAGLVLPVTRAGEQAVLKLQPVEPDNMDVATGLRTWNGVGAVLLLDHDEETGAVLLERLSARTLTSVEDPLPILAGLLDRLTSVAAPPGIRQLSDVARAMVQATPAATPLLRDEERALVRWCADAVAELVDDAGDRLLHWDLHYENVLAGDREPWLAIDPHPLAGDPGFDLLPAIDNLLAGKDIPATTRRRFDALVEMVALDRDRSVVWTLGRVLQNALWDIEDGKTALDPTQVAIATTMIEMARR